MQLQLWRNILYKVQQEEVKITTSISKFTLFTKASWLLPGLLESISQMSRWSPISSSFHWTQSLPAVTVLHCGSVALPKTTMKCAYILEKSYEFGSDRSHSYRMASHWLCIWSRTTYESPQVWFELPWMCDLHHFHLIGCCKTNQERALA